MKKITSKSIEPAKSKEDLTVKLTIGILLFALFAISTLLPDKR